MGHLRSTDPQRPEPGPASELQAEGLGFPLSEKPETRAPARVQRDPEACGSHSGDGPQPCCSGLALRPARAVGLPVLYSSACSGVQRGVVVLLPGGCVLSRPPAPLSCVLVPSRSRQVGPRWEGCSFKHHFSRLGMNTMRLNAVRTLAPVAMHLPPATIAYPAPAACQDPCGVFSLESSRLCEWGNCLHFSDGELRLREVKCKVHSHTAR